MPGIFWRTRSLGASTKRDHRALCRWASRSLLNDLPVHSCAHQPMKTALVGLLAALAALSVGGGAIPAVAAPRSEPAAQKPRRILILYDQNKDDFPGLARTDLSVREAFRAGLGEVEIYSESMNLSLSRRA